MNNTKQFKYEPHLGSTKLLDRVDNAYNYFHDFRLDELKEDDIYYINSFMDYIEYLEYKVDRLHKKLKASGNV
jgi:arylsulfatase A-like enzyme